MNLHIKQAVLHVLDTSIDTPVLSDACLELSADVYEFLSQHVERAAASDERKTCEFQEGSPFLTYPLHDLEQFLPTTREIALRLFQYMRIYPDIPAADVLMMQAEIDEQPHFVLLKLNYKESYIHFLQNGEEEKRTSIVRQRTVLPAPGGKGGETFLLNMATGGVQVIEKKFDIDGKKDFYFSSRFLECAAALSEKQKFQEIKKAAESVNELVWRGDKLDKKAETRVGGGALRLHGDAQEARVERPVRELYSDNPAAQGGVHPDPPGEARGAAGHGAGGPRHRPPDGKAVHPHARRGGDQNPHQPVRERRRGGIHQQPGRHHFPADKEHRAVKNSLGLSADK